MKFEATEAFALAEDAADPLRAYREEFLFPENCDGLYFAGNSLGLQPRKARAYVEQELEDWARYGVEGHFTARKPWLPYHENLTAHSAGIVGALPSEVVVMNTLTVNLHLMMVSFYRPTRERHRIVMEGGAFPSDRYAVASQARFHGYDPAEAVVELEPRPGETCLRTEDILARIDDGVALVLLGSVNYLTGQAFDLAQIAAHARARGACVGFDLAHGAGNLAVKLHDWGPDFAVWCGYKYLNGGPGAPAGCFVHERHARAPELPRFAGWWGHDKASRFKMGPKFAPIEGAEGWQLSNPPILSMAALRASLELFDRATMPALRAKSERLTGYLEFLLGTNPSITILTPRDPADRGCQLSLRVRGDARGLLKDLLALGVHADFREPDVIRAAPIPLYTRFQDVFRFARLLAEWLGR
jgi:kynureninase